MHVELMDGSGRSGNRVIDMLGGGVGIAVVVVTFRDAASAVGG